MYSIGQVSKRSNVSISTLRYYDEIGLLKPAEVNESGYRYYSDKELILLQHITALKEIGFTLKGIRNLLLSGEDADEGSLKSFYKIELEAIEEKRRKLDVLEKLLITANHAFELKGKADPDDILMFIKAIQTPPNIREAFLAEHFTDREIKIIKSLPDLSSNDPKTAQWVQLIRTAAKHTNEEPSSEISQRLAKQFFEISMEWFAQDEKLIEKYWTLIRPEEGMEEKVYGLDRKVMDYIDRIVDWYIAANVQEENRLNEQKNENDE